MYSPAYSLIPFLKQHRVCLEKTLADGTNITNPQGATARRTAMSRRAAEGVTRPDDGSAEEGCSGDCMCPDQAGVLQALDGAFSNQTLCACQSKSVSKSGMCRAHAELSCMIGSRLGATMPGTLGTSGAGSIESSAGREAKCQASAKCASGTITKIQVQFWSQSHSFLYSVRPLLSDL